MDKFPGQPQHRQSRSKTGIGTRPPTIPKTTTVRAIACNIQLLYMSIMFNHEDIVLHWVNRLGFISRSGLAARFRTAGHAISAEEWALLLMLWAKGPRTPSELAQETVKDRTTVTRLIDAMVRKGLVTRSEDAADRRRSIISLSHHGEQLKHQLIPIAQAFIAEAVAGVSPDDLETTTRTLRKITDTLTAQTDPRAPERS